MKHVQWDEEGLEKAAQDLHAITKRADRPPPEPKTPFIPTETGTTACDDLRIGGNITSSRVISGSSTEASEEEDFEMHRRHHYGHDGEALAKGRALLDEE